MKQYYFRISVSYSDYQNYYSGHASSVLVTTDEGLRIQLPASHFRPYLTYSGIRGRFRLITDNYNKFQSLELIT
ncbi:DUF2835 domain-containing protein [Parasalinivibrio latis]|uniref:DUF2835 domain-containing protein n=1 Tax=Parasalinivibrio latis TaxID=2952610 RepID=UPI0030E185C4